MCTHCIIYVSKPLNKHSLPGTCNKKYGESYLFLKMTLLVICYSQDTLPLCGLTRARGISSAQHEVLLDSPHIYLSQVTVVMMTDIVHGTELHYFWFQHTFSPFLFSLSSRSVLLSSYSL